MTVANTADKTLDKARPMRTAVKCPSSVRPAMDGPGQCAHSYGSEGQEHTGGSVGGLPRTRRRSVHGSRNPSRAPAASLRDRLRRPLTEPVCRQVPQLSGSGGLGQATAGPGRDGTEEDEDLQLFPEHWEKTDSNGDSNSQRLTAATADSG
jgi:hypothetical protein